MPRKNPEPKFEYVIARPWDAKDPGKGLCIYTYFTDVQHGTLTQAQAMLEYVRHTARHDGDTKKDADSYSIYVVGFTRLPF